MYICTPLQNICTNGHYAPQCHNTYRTQTHMLQLIMTGLMNVPPRMLQIMTAKATERNPQLFAGKTVSVLNDMRNLWLPAIAMAHT